MATDMQNKLYTDDLTGLYNRRFFNQCLSEETDRSIKKHLTFALVMLDMDHFKEINDQYGHLEGDQALVWMAGILKRSVRQGDVIIRFAGDEFFLILPGATKKEALTVTQRIYSTINDNPFKGFKQQVDIPVNVSGGVAFFPQDANTPESLIKLADQGLYLAKERGRGQTCMGKEAEAIKSQINLGDVLKIPPFIGRDQLLKQITSNIIEICKNQSSHFFLFMGQEGVGKSRFVNELFKSARLPSLVIQFRLPYQETKIPLIGLKRIMEEIGQTHESEYYNALLSLPECEKKLILAWTGASQIPNASNQEEVFSFPGFKAPGFEVELHFALTHLFESLAEALPLIIIMDDFQWIDHETCQFFTNLLFHIQNKTIILIATVQDSVNQRSLTSEIDKYLAYLSKQNLLRSITLAPLSSGEIKLWVRSLFPQSSDIFQDILSRHLFLSSGGNAFLIKEALQSIPVDKWMTLIFNPLSLEREIQKLIPERISQNLQKNYHQLSGDLKTLLTFLSCLDEPCGYEIIKQLSSFNEGHLIDLLDKAVSDGWLKERSQGNLTSFYFHNHHSRLFLANQISNIKKVKTHQMILDFLLKKTKETSAHAHDPVSVETLFTHAHAAGNLPSMIEFGNLWISECYENRAFTLIEKIFQILKNDCQNSGISDFLTNQSLKICCEALFQLGYYDLFLELQPNINDSQFNLSMNYQYYNIKGQYKKSCQIAKYLYEEADSSQKRVKWGIAYAESLIKVKDFIELHLIQEQLKQAILSIHEDYEGLLYKAGYFKFLGNYHFSSNQIDKALECYDLACTTAQKLKSPSMECLSLINIGAAQFKLQKFEEAKESWLKAQALAFKCGIKNYILQIMNNLGNIYRIVDDWDMAEQIFTQCLNLAETHEEKPVMLACYINLGLVYLKKQNFRQSGFFLHTGLILAEELKETRTEALFHDRMGDLQFELKNNSEARKQYKMALSTYQSLFDHESILYMELKLLKLMFIDKPNTKSRKAKISKIQAEIKKLSPSSPRKDELWQQSLALEI